MVGMTEWSDGLFNMTGDGGWFADDAYVKSMTADEIVVVRHYPQGTTSITITPGSFTIPKVGFDLFEFTKHWFEKRPI